MFGLGRNTSNYSRGATGGSKLRGALLAGAGLLAYRWWQNRKHQTTNGGNGASDWSKRNNMSGSQNMGHTGAPTGFGSSQSGFAAGGTTPGSSAF